MIVDFNFPSTSTHSIYETTSGSKIFGALIGQTDDSGRAYRFYYDANNGQLAEITYLSSSRSIKYEYDENGRLIRSAAVDPNGTEEFTILVSYTSESQIKHLTYRAGEALDRGVVGGLNYWRERWF